MTIEGQTNPRHHPPEKFDKGTPHDFRDFGKIFVRIEHALFTAQQGGETSRWQSVEVYGTHCVKAGKQQKQEEPQVVFGVEGKAFLKKAVQPFLFKRPDSQWNRTRQSVPQQRNLMTVLGHSAANAVHPLVVAKVVRDGKNNLHRRLRYRSRLKAQRCKCI